MADAARASRRRPKRAAPRAESHQAAAWSARHGWTLVCAALFLAALIWRALYLGRLERSPLYGDLILDSREYWMWASALRSGATAGASPYFLGPLYPTGLWLIRSLLGDQIRTVLLAQATLGALSAVLIADAARRLTRPAVGVTIGAIAALYQMAVFFDGLVLMESLLWTLSAFLLWWVCRVDWSRARAPHVALLGAIIGLLSEGRAISAVLLGPALFLLAPAPVPARARAIQRAGILVGAFAIVAAPAAIHNLRASGEWIPFTYNFGYNLYIGNNPEATGTDVTITGTQAPVAPAGSSAVGGAAGDGREYLRASEHLELGPAASSAHWARMAMEYIGAHPMHAAALYFRKLAMLWSAYEYPQVENADEFRRFAGPLGLPFFGEFAWVGVLAIIGLSRVRSGGRAAWFASLSCATLSFAIAVFFVTDRYRHQLVPGALLLAALGIDAALAAARSRSRREVWALAGLLVLGVIVTRLPIPHLGGLKYQWGLEEDIGRRYLVNGRADLALEHFQRAIQLEDSGRIHFEGGVTGAMERMQLYFNLGNALVKLGRTQEALPWLERAAQLAPDHAGALSALASAYREVGRAAEAEALEHRMGALAGGASLSMKSRAFDAARAGMFAAAESLFTAAVAEDGSQFDAWGALIRLQIQRHDVAAARATLARARARGLGQAAADTYQALLEAMSGNTSAARVLLARVPQQSLDADPALREVASWIHQLIGP
jgi:tetratricopeptide (TPR) repeat protein